MTVTATVVLAGDDGPLDRAAGGDRTAEHLDHGGDLALGESLERDLHLFSDAQVAVLGLVGRARRLQVDGGASIGSARPPGSGAAAAGPTAPHRAAGGTPG